MALFDSGDYHSLWCPCCGELGYMSPEECPWCQEGHLNCVLRAVIDIISPLLNDVPE